MRRQLLAFIFVALPCASLLTVASGRAVAPPQTGNSVQSSAGVDLAALDRATDPCDDFYQFACGGWMNSHPVPADRAIWSRFDELQERNDETLRRILEMAADSPNAETRQIGDYYGSCMDERAIDAAGSTPLRADLDAISSLSDVKALPALLARLHPSGVNAFFRFAAVPDFENARMELAWVGAGGLGLPERDFYFRDDARSADLRREYTAHVGRMNQLLGTPAESAARAATTVMMVETTLAKGQLDVVSRRDPAKVNHKLTLAELQALSPRFDWRRYIDGIGAKSAASLNVSQPDFVRAFDALLGTTPVEDVRTYLTWQLVHANAAVLATPFVNENFRFYGTTLAGTPQLRPRWKRCVQYTDADLGEALGRAYVKEAFSAKEKADTVKMVQAIEDALKALIGEVPWMTADTKQQALVKLRAVAKKIGYPDRWRDYRGLRVVRGDALGNSQRANAFEFHRDIGKIGRKVDPDEWGMTPPTVNAYYSPTENNINFPAGILQPPFYYGAGDPPTNFGAAGTIVGHELTHGFDDQGRKYDAGGNLHDWWKPQDARSFEERAACLADQYSGFTAVDNVKVNGKLTLGENIADNGGLRLALMAYMATAATGPGRTVDGFTPEQRLLIGFAQIWCENARPEAIRLRVQTNPHSPGRFRANGVVSNMLDFPKAFSCRAGAPMVRANACRVW